MSLPRSDVDLVERLWHYDQAGAMLVDDRNAKYVQRELERHAQWFGHLTKRQRQAIVKDEDNCLALAGAGTGKTTTIIEKVRFLLLKGHADPPAILVLAFAKDAEKELRERFASLNEPTLTVSTFHALGHHVVAQVEGHKQSVSRLATDENYLLGRLNEFISSALCDESAYESIREYFAGYLRPYQSEFAFK